MTSYPKSKKFEATAIPWLGCKAVHGVLYVGLDAKSNLEAAVIGPDSVSALKAANRLFGIEFDPKGAQRVVLMDEAKFRDLVALAGVKAA